MRADRDRRQARERADDDPVPRGFGVHGQKVPGVVSWITSIGWETMLAISAVLATATLFQALGLASGTPVLVIATLVIAAIIVTAPCSGITRSCASSRS